MTHSIAGYCICAFLGMLSGGFAGACGEVLWSRKAHRQYQATIFGLVSMVALAVMASVVLGGAFLADRIFEPALRRGGAWDGVAAWLGHANGGGLALLFVLAGAIGSIFSVAGLLNVRLRNLDYLVPDAHVPGDGISGIAEPAEIID